MSTIFMLFRAQRLLIKFSHFLAYDPESQRLRPVYFPFLPNWFTILNLPTTDYWYHVRFYDIPDPRVPLPNGIRFEAWSRFDGDVYGLWLSPDQASFLLRSNLAELAPVDDKVDDFEVSLSDADHLYLETAPVFDVKNFRSLKFTPLGDGYYIVRSHNLKRAAALLSKCPSVYRITVQTAPGPDYSLDYLFSQLATQIPCQYGSAVRDLQSKGLNGSGVVVTIIDTFLDHRSTFFHDPNVPAEEGKPLLAHRKLAYYDNPPAKSMDFAEHGTHVAGIVAGFPLLANCTRYAGVAPDAKIAFLGAREGYFRDRMADALQIMGRVNSCICANSWGRWPNVEPKEATAMNQQAYENPDKLFVFAGGNSGQNNSHIGGHETIDSPASAKNVFTVGALRQLPVPGPRSNDVWIRVLAVRRGQSDVILTVAATRYPSSSDPFVAGTSFIQGYVSTNLKHPGRHQLILLARTTYELASINNSFIHPLAVITFNHLLVTDSVPFPVFYCSSDVFAPAALPSMLVPGDTLSFTIMCDTRLDEGTGPGVAYFSSRGTTEIGLMKPEVVGPGTNIVSAQSNPGTFLAHLSGELLVMIKSGTSMAVPYVAAIAALFQQYCQGGMSNGTSFIPSGILMRLVLILTADPLTAGDKTINTESGFGQVNLGKHLPFRGDPFQLCLGNGILIGSQRHLVAFFSVVNTSGEVRVAMGYLDRADPARWQFPLICDLDLIIVSPNGTVFRGNGRPDNTEERFTTLERVIIDPADLEVGLYKVHVIAAHRTSERETKFSIAAVGGITTDKGYFVFTPADDCATPCVNGTCDSATFTCSCPADRVGHACQTGVELYHGLGSQVEFTVPPFGLKYLSFDGDLGRFVRYNLSTQKLVGSFQIYGIRADSADIPNDYKNVKLMDNRTQSAHGTMLWVKGKMSFLVRNNAQYDQKFSLLIEEGSWTDVFQTVVDIVRNRLFITGVVGLILLVVVYAVVLM
jgi:subtilisin family serine protease